MRAGHSCVCNVCGAFFEDFFVGGGNVRVCAENAGDFAVEVLAHRDFFAGGLGVHIDENNVGGVFNLRQEFIYRIERALGWFHEYSAYELNYGNGKALAGLIEGEILFLRRLATYWRGGRCCLLFRVP